MFRTALIQVPNNGWALYGLWQTKKARGDQAGARATEQALRRAWTGDVSKLSLAQL